MSEVAAPAPPIVWTELRDERGKLCARLDAGRLLLELHRNHQWVVFDLREYFVYYEFTSMEAKRLSTKP